MIKEPGDAHGCWVDRRQGELGPERNLDVADLHLVLSLLGTPEDLLQEVEGEVRVVWEEEELQKMVVSRAWEKSGLEKGCREYLRCSVSGI